MSPDTTVGPGIGVAIVVVKTLILLLGGMVTYFAFKAYRRTRQRSLGALALGFGLITVGVLLAGFVNEILRLPLGYGVLIESLLVLAGLGVIAYSLYAQ